MHLASFHQKKQALGGDTTLVLVATNSFDPTALFQKLWRSVFTFEMNFSRFLPNSELSQFNQKSGLNVPISDEFRDLLEASVRLSALTDGYHNPFVLPALQRAGYTHSALSGYETDRDYDYTKRAVVPFDQLQLLGNNATIPYGTAIDLGGCGKGYLADQLADMLDQEELAGYWISLSGDIALRGTDENGKPWKVAIQNANNTDSFMEEFVAGNCKRMGVATSGTLKRPNQTLAGKHHIIDSRTGKPAGTDILLSTVQADTSLLADVLASCSVIVGSNQVKSFLQSKGANSGLIQAQKGSVHFGDSIRKPINMELAHAT